MGVAGTGAERAPRGKAQGSGSRWAEAMIPPQEASARRREIEDKLKQVRLRMGGAGEGRGRDAGQDIYLGRRQGWEGALPARR